MASPSPSKSLSPAELAALEQAFAADPSSGAWRQLTEAYVSMGRFMEAIVVCKKGVKLHAGDASARVMLASVYAAQGKDRKALEELGEALRAHPNDAAANRMAGQLQFRLGEKEAGTAALQKAFAAAPADPETLEAMRKWGVAPPPPPAPPPAAQPPVRPPQPTAAQPAAAEVAPAASARAPAAAPHPQARPVRNEAYADHLAEKFQTEEWQLRHRPPKRGPSKATVLATLGLAIAMVGGLGGWWAFTAYKKRRAIEIDRLLKQTRELLEKDSWASYKEAARLCERILDRDADSLGGRAYLAYVSAVRWGEHGEPEGLREEAKKQVALALKLGQTHSHLLAAEAYLQYYGGDPRGAADRLTRFLSSSEGATSSLLHGTLGIIRMQVGDLEGARDALLLAQKYAPGDVRIVQHLAELYRRRGAGFELAANTLYDIVLQRLSKEHVPSILGQALLLLERDQAELALKGAERVLGMGENASPRQVAMAHVIRGGALHALGRAADGAAAEQQALTIDPTSPDIHDVIGRRRLHGKDWRGAAEQFQKAMQLDPVRVSFVKSLGDAYRAGGDADQAVARYQKAVQMEPKAVEARIALTQIWRERRDYPKALEELDRAQKALGSGGTGTGLSQVLVETAEVEEARGGKFDAVRDLYVRALKADGLSCPALFWLGRQAFEQKKADEARALLGDYLRICPHGPKSGEVQRIASALR